MYNASGIRGLIREKHRTHTCTNLTGLRNRLGEPVDLVHVCGVVNVDIYKRLWANYAHEYLQPIHPYGTLRI